MRSVLLHLFSFKLPTSWAEMNETSAADCASSMRNGVKKIHTKLKDFSFSMGCWQILYTRILYTCFQTTNQILSILTMNSNTVIPSIFIRLPRLPGTKWVPADIVDVLDKYGDIKEVRINKDIRGGQFAVVHFNEWYSEGMKIASAVLHSKPVKVRALYRKYFNLILFKAPAPTASKVANVPVAPGISFGNPGQLSALEFLAQKQQNEAAASVFMQMLNKEDGLMTRRLRADSRVSDITMEDDFEGTVPHYYRHYALEEGEII